MQKIVILALCLFIAAACSPTGQSAPTAQPNNTSGSAAAQPTADSMAAADAMPTAQTAAENTMPTAQTAAENAMPAADWLALPLVNVNTGETFTLGGFAGKTVYVHPMARWCTNCRSSQRRLRDDVLPAVNLENVVFVSFTIETGDTTNALKEYATNENFNWVFAVATPELVNALVAQYGFAVSNPPSQPHFIVRPDGTFTDLMTGNPSAADTIALLNGMSS